MSFETVKLNDGSKDATEYVKQALETGFSHLDTGSVAAKIIKETGLAKSTGVRNFTLEQLQKLVKTDKIILVVNQIDIHPYNYAERKALLAYSAAQGIITEPSPPLPPDKHYAPSRISPIMKQLGGPVDTPVQAILKWVQQKGVAIVMCVPVAGDEQA
ncbi:hypothetical protein OE88DRAFT_1734904 [Heliocybe sulcata]|uniref:NADP-dependent oxidoreductase domain-containing protein n=1 Tax=Heliocybe sulcata TaxID=5364 RepID=A0A5C3N5X8_9AGAM|nr:hypothetical protein OE88DRAFT_1734904 [Heliocybe sulcata]